MATDREDRIKRRAYELWEAEGRPEGRQAEHWEQAAREIEAENHTGAGESPEGGQPNGSQESDTAPGAESPTGGIGVGAAGRRTGAAKRVVSGSSKPGGAARPIRKKTEE